MPGNGGDLVQRRGEAAPGVPANPDLVTHALRMLRKEGGGAHMLDALRQALVMLNGGHRDGGASSS